MPTRSPMLSPSTPAPIASIRPTISWPGMIGTFGSGSSPSTTCRSVRQTPQAATFTRNLARPGSLIGEILSIEERSQASLAPSLAWRSPVPREAHCQCDTSDQRGFTAAALLIFGGTSAAPPRVNVTHAVRYSAIFQCDMRARSYFIMPDLACRASFAPTAVLKERPRCPWPADQVCRWSASDKALHISHKDKRGRVRRSWARRSPA